MKVICLDENDDKMKYLEIYEAQQVRVPRFDITFYFIQAENWSLTRYPPAVIPLEEYRNNQLNKIIAE